MSGAYYNRDELMKIAIKYYPEKTLAHAIRVATLTADLPFLDGNTKNNLWTVGLLHDLFEDTDCDRKEISRGVSHYIFQAIELLTQQDGEPYEDYIKRIVDSGNSYAITVKRLDMKDHLAHTKTLTERLKAKYYPVVHYLL